MWILNSLVGINLFRVFRLLTTMHVGLATNFQPTGDPWNPVAYAACLHRDLKESDVVVAHPTLPCGSKVFLYSVRTHRSAVATIGDRGPRHAMVDLAPATTKLLRANGWESMVMIPMED